MDEIRAINERHSVRAYKRMPLSAEDSARIREQIALVNTESGLSIQLIEDTEGVYGSFASRLIGWKGTPPASLALVGKAGDDLDEKCGYYGEKLVLYLQSIGVNTCWTGLFKRDALKVDIAEGERLVIAVAVGYGINPGRPRRSKPIDKVTDVTDMPEWFRRGMECALKAPTAVNQQKFFVSLDGDKPVFRVSAPGPFAKVDLGIVKYHFEVGARQ